MCVEFEATTSVTAAFHAIKIKPDVTIHAEGARAKTKRSFSKSRVF